ncbi:MAG: lipoyl(octanoyl) transferase LipB [bacterium]
MNTEQIKILGKIDYDSAVNIQLAERQKVKDGLSCGTIFFLEHVPPVITLGRNAINSNILFPRKLLENKGYHVRDVSRGGDVTVHEPGQLVVYFVMPLKAKAVRNFVDGIVGSIRTCLLESFGVQTFFDETKPGLWVNEKKICSIGFDLTQKVSMHGVAINVCNSLEGFSLIVPCGLSGVKMTTLTKETGRPVSLEELTDKLTDKYLSLF